MPKSENESTLTAVITEYRTVIFIYTRPYSNERRGKKIHRSKNEITESFHAHVLALDEKMCVLNINCTNIANNLKSNPLIRGEW